MEFFDPPSPETHLEDPLESALRIANPTFDVTAPLTFRNFSRFDLAAAGWRDTIFVPTLLPAIVTTLDLASAGEVREIIELETNLLATTTAATAPALIAEGRRLAEATGDPRGDRVLPRLHAAIRSGQMRGHFTVLFAARCAVFSIPTRVALGAYLLQELLAGSPDIRASRALDFAATCLDTLDLTAPQLRAA